MTSHLPEETTLSPVRLSRRYFALGVASVLALGALPFSRKLRADAVVIGPVSLKGDVFDLAIGYQTVNFTGREKRATTVNQSLPAPLLRWQEGQTVTLRVTNHLDVDSSLHWHGLILPFEMDGVPGLSFDGIKPGETFEYRFEVRQSGTYWYHSHSGFQEQTGLYGAIIIDPKDPDPVRYDRDMVVLLSDWSDEEPETIYAKLKKMSHYYNFRARTLGDLWRDVSANGLSQTWKERAMWNRMRMSQTDIADVTGHTYTYLINGVTPDQGWLGLFLPGEKVRLRFINGAAMSIFDVRIPGLKMTVVAADGQNIQPVEVDEFRIAVAETYDVIVEPDAGRAYTIFAQSNDRSGYARGTLTTDPYRQGEIPAMDPAPLLGYGEMGMAMAAMDHGSHQATDDNGTDHSGHAMGKTGTTDHRGHSATPVMDHLAAAGALGKSPLAKAGYGSNFTESVAATHTSTEFGAHVDYRSQSPPSGLLDPGIGLRDHQRLYGRRVLNYGDIRSLAPTLDKREPSREIELHLTGNMARYMWSINGIPFASAEPLILSYGERLRIILVNDTMMTHPIHLHGMWGELETGDPLHIPRKHTIIVQPGARISYLVTADARGRWAFHCHLLYHMAGMMREVRVV